MSSRAHYEEIRCRTALNRVSGMGFRWSLNPYRGCVHGCHYCFARRYHAYYDLDTGKDFTGIIMVKVNVAQVLREELSRRSWRRETVAIGTATDPYQPIEGKYRLTRSCLEAFVKRHSPISLVTKGSLVLRDVDVLAELARRAECTVCFSITTMNNALVRRLEPGTPPPQKRLMAMERLAKAGVTAGVLLAPIVPGITDNVDNLAEVTKAAASHGACFFGANVLHLKPGTKEHFLDFLQKEHPSLLAEYKRLYPGSYAPKQFQEQVQERVAELRETYGLEARSNSSSRVTMRSRQLELPLG